QIEELDMSLGPNFGLRFALPAKRLSRPILRQRRDQFDGRPERRFDRPFRPSAAEILDLFDILHESGEFREVPPLLVDFLPGLADRHGASDEPFLVTPGL